MEEPVPPSPDISPGEGFWIRAAARIIDTLYGIALGFVGGVIAGIAFVVFERSGLIAAGWQSRLNGPGIGAFAFSLLGAVFYHSLTEGICGASIGKLICQLRVVTEQREPIGLGQAFVRSLAYYIDALFFGIVAFTSMQKSGLNQRYGDRWAHTVVIKSKDLPSSSARGIELFVLAFLMGTVCYAALIALGLIVHAM